MKKETIEKFMAIYYENVKYKFKGDKLLIQYSKKYSLEKVKAKLKEKGLKVDVGCFWTSEKRKVEDLTHAIELLLSEIGFISNTITDWKIEFDSLC